MELDRDRAVQEIVAAAGYLRKMDRVSPKKIGVTGWCMGGSLAVAAAARATDLGAVVAFYGMPRDLTMVQDIHTPLLGLYGAHDHGITTEMIREFDQELKKRGVPHEIHQYPDAGHAFFNDTRPEAYHPQASEDAWRRTLDWLHLHLA